MSLYYSRCLQSTQFTPLIYRIILESILVQTNFGFIVFHMLVCNVNILSSYPLGNKRPSSSCFIYFDHQKAVMYYTWFTYKYSRTSVTRTRMARTLWITQTVFYSRQFCQINPDFLNINFSHS